MSESKAKCPSCKLLFCTSFENVKIKACPCCEYVGNAEDFFCTEEEWLKKKKLKKAFLSSVKRGEARKENKLREVKKIFRRPPSKD